MGPIPAKPAPAIRILVVDDNESVRKQLSAFLHNADRCFVICGEAADAKQAVTKTQELRPDAIILDLALPDGDGLAVAREIGAMPHKPAIFMFTMHNSPRLELEAQSAGILQVVSKPAAVNLVVLLRELARSKSPEGTPETTGS